MRGASFIDAVVKEVIDEAFPDYDELRQKVALFEYYRSTAQKWCDQCACPCKTYNVMPGDTLALIPCGKTTHNYMRGAPCHRIIACGRPWCKLETAQVCCHCDGIICDVKSYYADPSMCTACSRRACIDCRMACVSCMAYFCKECLTPYGSPDGCRLCDACTITRNDVQKHTRKTRKARRLNTPK